MVEISAPTLLIGLAINGIFTGIGVAIGTYLANKHIINAIEKVGEKVKNKKLTKFREYLEKIKKQSLFIF